MSEETIIKKAPGHHAYIVRSYENAEGEADAQWLKIGAAWSHKDGEGFDVVLEALPVTGRVVGNRSVIPS